MRRTQLILRVLAICLTLSLPSQGAANPIVDTGTPSFDFPWGFGTVVFTGSFAGEFTIADSYVIQSIEGYFSNANGVAGTVDIAIHADDGGNTPGTILFSASKPMAAAAPLDWYGVFGLNQVLNPGTYWASFTPNAGIVGYMPGTAPTPLSEYAYATAGNPWLDLGPDYFDYVDVGVRINGDLVTTSVPDSTSTLSLFIGVALLGFVAHRLWT